MSKVHVTIKITDPEMLAAHGDMEETTEFDAEGVMVGLYGVPGNNKDATTGLLGSVSPKMVATSVMALPFAEEVVGLIIAAAFSGSFGEPEGDKCDECNDIECASHPANVAPEKAKVVSVNGNPPIDI